MFTQYSKQHKTGHNIIEITSCLHSVSTISYRVYHALVYIRFPKMPCVTDIMSAIHINNDIRHKVYHFYANTRNNILNVAIWTTKA